jgi:DNA-binding NarL/FixJ family response regulator
MRAKNYVSALLAKFGLTRRVQAAVMVSEIKSDQARHY